MYPMSYRIPPGTQGCGGGRSNERTRTKILKMIEVTSQGLNAKITNVTNASQRAKEKTASSLVEL